MIAGEQTDPNGLLFLRARYYNPTLGSFLSRDPLDGAGSAISFNGYAYAAANPVNLTDPSGLDPDELFPFLDPLRHTIRSGLAALPSLETVAGVVAAANEKLRQRLMGECASPRKLKAAFDNGYFAVRAVKISAEVVGTAALAVEGGLAALELAGGAPLVPTLLDMFGVNDMLANMKLSAPIRIGKFRLPGLFNEVDEVAAGEELGGLLGGMRVGGHQGLPYVEGTTRSAKNMVQQQLQHSCGPACALQTLNDAGVTRDATGKVISESMLRKLAKFSHENGTLPGDLAKALNRLHKDAEYLGGAYDAEYAPRAFELLASSGRPWIAGVRPIGAKVAHGVIVDKVENGLVYVRDPLSLEGGWGYVPGFGSRGAMRVDDFFKVWENADFSTVYRKQ